MSATQPQPAPDVLAWLAENGWAPGRDIGERAVELVELRVRDAERQGLSCRHRLPLCGSCMVTACSASHTTRQRAKRR